MRRHAEGELGLPHGLGAVGARRRARRVGADQQVGAAGGQRIPVAAEHFGGKAQGGGAGQGAKILDQIVQRRPGQHGADGDAQFAFPAGSDALDAAGQRVERLQHVAAFGQQGLAGGREGGPMAAAVEQQHVQSVFQLADGVSDGRRHLAQFARRLGEAAMAGDGVDHDEQVGRDGLAGGRGGAWTGHGGLHSFKLIE
ncbi:Uncharacterised protein [Bordetella pertussis]|nr:Uncharacterised protein [Bordetella pertussis]